MNSRAEHGGLSGLLDEGLSLSAHWHARRSSKHTGI
jgi:hypothetical protein